MNQFEGFTRPVIGGHQAILRLGENAEARPVLCEGGKPRIFADELSAQRALTNHLLAYLNGHLRRDGEKAGKAREEAEKLFGASRVVKQRGKTRRVEVVRL